jgi:hypothetical protein
VAAVASQASEPSGERLVGGDGERGGVGVVTAEVDGAELGRGPRVPGLLVLVRPGPRGDGLGRGDRLGGVGRRVVGKRLGAERAVERLLGRVAVTGERRVVEPGLLDAGERRIGRRHRRARRGMRGRGHGHGRDTGSARPRPGMQRRRRREDGGRRLHGRVRSRGSGGSRQLHRGAGPGPHHGPVRAARRRHRRSGGERGDRRGGGRARGRQGMTPVVSDWDEGGGSGARGVRCGNLAPGEAGGPPSPRPGNGTAPSRSRSPSTDGGRAGGAASVGRRGISVWQVLHLSLAPPGGMRRSSMLYAVWQDGHVMRMWRAPEASRLPRAVRGRRTLRA